ncbi:C4-dicarboxylate ABC transporter permease [Roseibium polysiphoniae]|uniref:TRAP transporter small permease protein n=1 Tax=Roseibium polysiphoniae TaxID=2571221 RepID=A0A944GST2_9HYPH|nr:TRAP transporter small permease subunit [Roseibium polysiphoniae]MBS8259911.1 C4-dicarboxylate ABC transporter permease [Roseibium polysiphoniae]
MLKILDLVSGGASCAVRFIGSIAAWSGLALVLLVAFNVLARYLFSYSTVGLQEAEWHLMAVAALFGMSYGLNQGGEVRVDIFYARYSPRAKAIIDVIGNAALCVVAVYVVSLSINYVTSSYAIMEGSPDPGGLPMRFLLKAAIPAAFVLLALQAFAMTLRAIGELTDTGSRHSGSA